MESQYITDRGQVRAYNEDAVGIFVNEDKQLLAIVADGMGGHQAGDVASELAVTTLQDKWQAVTTIETPIEAEEWLQMMLEEANAVIFKHSQTESKLEGMGTTAVVAICTEEFITIAHVGDSRCYLFRKQGLEQITSDHSLVNELVRTGQISAEDAEQHPRKNILVRALGTEDKVTIDIETISWEEGDSALLCSDGLTNMVKNAEIEAFLLTNTDIKNVSEELVNFANKRGGDDNISIALVRNVSQKAGDTLC